VVSMRSNTEVSLRQGVSLIKQLTVNNELCGDHDSGNFVLYYALIKSMVFLLEQFDR